MKIKNNNFLFNEVKNRLASRQLKTEKNNNEK